MNRRDYYKLGEPFGPSATRVKYGKARIYGGGGGAQTSTSTTQNYSPEEAARRTQVMDEALKVYGQTAPQIAASDYPGAKPVPFSQESIAAQNLAVQNAFGAQQGIDQINQGVNYGMTTAMDVDNNPYLAKAVEGAIRPITQSYTDTGGVMSQIRDGSVDAGQFGSSRQGIAEGIAGGRYAQEIGDVSSKMYSAAYDKGQDTFARTLMFAPEALKTGMLPAEWLSGVGAQKEDLAQAMANYETDAQMWDYNSQWAPLNNLANLIYGGGSSQGTTTSTQPSAPRNSLGGAAGGAMIGTSIGGPWGAAAGGILGALMG